MVFLQLVDELPMVLEKANDFVEGHLQNSSRESWLVATCGLVVLPRLYFEAFGPLCFGHLSFCHSVT